jgi:carboxyl-terminal processing protease
MSIPITRKQVVNLGALILICGAWFAIGWVVRGLQLSPDVQMVEQVRQRLLAEHPGPTPSTRELSYAAIRGMLGQVDDPYSALITPPISARFWDDFAGRSGVICLFPERLDGEMVVSVVFPGEPAHTAGLRVGDVILSIDDVVIDRETSDAEVILLVRGPVGQPAHFVVRRGDEILEFSPVREERSIVSSRMLPGGIGYLAQYTFATDSSHKVREALLDLLSQDPQGLIWDLSSNGGGSMEAAQDILSYFIDDGLLFTAELKDGKQRRFVAEGDAIAADLPLVVLVGERTYSAAETCAATIADSGRGTLIGAKTYGKGAIQATYPLGEDVLLQMTVAKWLSPKGQVYHGRGVSPHILASDDEDTAQDEVLEYAADYLLQHLASK